MKKRRTPSAAATARLTPLEAAPVVQGADVLCDERCEDPLAAFKTAPPKTFPRLRTLAALAHDHVAAMHSGAFVARSRQRWQQQQNDEGESDGARAHRVSRESAALVLQSAWRRSAAVRLRARLVRGVWQQHMALAAWLTHDREQLREVLAVLLKADATTRRPLVAAQRFLLQLSSSESDKPRVPTLRGASTRLPALFLATWLCFSLGLRRRSRFLRRPAPAILHAVHIPVRTTCRLYLHLWHETTRLAARAIQSRARAFLARCAYWRLLRAHRRAQAAVRLQSVYRAWVARRLVWRLRRRRAAVRIQCAWRVHRARCRVQSRRVNLIATQFLSGIQIQALERVSAEIVQRSACRIQRTFRGHRARAHFRVLVARRYQRQWHKNPSRGYRLFARRCYLEAAVYLERCFRQGIFQDDDAGRAKQTWVREKNTRPVSRGREVEHHRNRLIPSGSRLTYSFSEAPTPLDPDLVSNAEQHRFPSDRRPASPSHDLPVPSSRVTPLAKQLQFWQTYALSHWFSFQSNGDPLHLKQARVGFEAFLRLDATSPRESESDVDLQILRLHTRVCLVYCVYWSRKQQRDASGDDELALSLCIEVLDELEMLSGPINSDVVHQAKLWRAELLMTSAALYLNEQEHEACCAQLRTLLAMAQRGESSVFDEIDLRFLLAVVILQSNRSHPLDPMGEAEIHLKFCYQQIELWPGVGFYHGEVDSASAAARLQEEPVGSFLLHHEAVERSQLGTAATTEKKLLLKVKLSDDPCKISSLRIHFENGQYHMKKLPNCSDFSVHELIQQLPPAAGIQWSQGVRRAIYVPALAKKLPTDHQTLLVRRARLLHWQEWAWRLSTSNTRHNDCWGALCQLFAVRLEASNAHEMAALIARDGLVVARDRALRASLFFALGRACSQLQRRVEATLAMKHAAIESARLAVPFDRNFVAVMRAVAGIGTHSHSFANQLERIGKLERMCVKAWSFDSCSPMLRGHPFCEALLLQRVHDDLGDESVADTFFVRALLRAHMKAFLGNGYYESTHVDLAFTCVRWLFERFYQLGASIEDFGGVSTCGRHVSMMAWRDVTTQPSEFSFHALLLTWHRIPFQVAFEMAEVFYRWPLMSTETLIDVYESLYGRLRSVKPRNWAYSAFEELLLVRLAFLYAQRTNDTSDLSSQVLLAQKSVELFDELIGLRRLRTLSPHAGAAVKRIQWPSSLYLRFPLQFSENELIFMRGLLWERVSELDGNSKVAKATAHANAWRDFDCLHSELLAVVLSEQELERVSAHQRKKLKGVRVFVGETMDVGVSDVLYSKPYVVVQREKQQLSTQHSATWMNRLSPSWDEHVEIDVGSSKARLSITVMNRSTRLRRRQDGDQVLGYVQVYMEQLLTNTASYRSPQWYNLKSRGADTGSGTNGKHPRIRLAFQLVMQAVDNSESTSGGRFKRNIRGNWDMSQVKQHIHGDLRRFVRNAWVWRCFARHWLADKEFCIAAWFIQRAIALTDRNEQDALVHAGDLVDLATCYRATVGASWLEYAREMLEKAKEITQTAYRNGGSSDLSLRKQLSTISSMLGGGGVVCPLTEELVKRIPASSTWIAMRKHHGSSDDVRAAEVYYFNEDTCERFRGVVSEPQVRTPLEWETDTERAVIMMTSRDPLCPRRIVIMTTEMKARVAFHCAQQHELHAKDPQQWVAVFNPRKQIMQFLSLASPDDSEEQSGVVMTTTQPLLYAMLADEFLLYHVLVVQDAFRKYQQRLRRQRRVRGLLGSAFSFACERRAAQRRIEQCVEAARRRKLNCLHVVIERASKLRAMDLFTSDPFVVVELVDADGDVVAKGETSVKRNTVNPQWHEEFNLLYAYVDHAHQQSQQRQAPVLRLRVFDRDLVRGMQQRDDEEAKQAIDEELDSDSDGEKQQPSDQQRKHDFLGRAETAIAPLVHGKCVTADFVLQDEDGSPDEDSGKAVSRGTLTVTVQWVHDADHASVTHARRNAVKPMLLVRPRKRTRPKPIVSAAMLDLLETARRAREALLACMGDLGVLMDQLVRLFKRWRVAQASGRTADEAKLMEQRLCAATTTPQPFHSKYAALAATAETAHTTATAVLRALTSPIRDWLESCERQAAATLTATFTTATKAIQEQKAAAAMPFPWDSGVQAFPGHMGLVLALGKSVVTWRQELLVLLETFFEPPTPTWEEPAGALATIEMFARIDEMLQSAMVDEASRPGSPSKSPTKSAPVAALPASGMATGLTVPTASTPASTVASTPTNSAVAKRMERIERAKRKAQKKK